MTRGTEQRVADILVHQYFGVDVATVRDVIETYLPKLTEALRDRASE